MANLADLEKRIAELQEKKRKLIANEKAKERKERTRRLIQIGALVEKYGGEIVDFESFENYLDKYGYAIKNTQPKADEVKE